MLSCLKKALCAVTLCYTVSCAYAQQDSVTQSVTLDGVEIKARKYTSKVKSRANGQLTVDMELLGHLPQILGHADPIHYSQMLPEIQTNGELRGGVNIQGSDNSHNLVAIGGIPLHNVCHLLGFFSTFNSPHFERFTLRKMNDATSANRIGGALSMELSHTVPDTASGEFSTGLISSQGTWRWALSKRTLLTTSVRTSYINALYSRWLKAENVDVDYAFSDFNVSLLHQLSDYSDILVDYYGGFDKGGFGDASYTARIKANWGNQMAAIHHHYKKSHLQLNHTAYLTYYRNRLGFTMQDIHYQLPSSICDLGLKHQGVWSDLAGGELAWGAEAIWHDVKPQSLHASGTITSGQKAEPAIGATELSLYASYKMRLSPHLLGECGLRGSLFGPSNSEVQMALDPSLSLHYSQGNVECYAGYALKHQYLFQTGFSDAGLPTEFWLPSDQHYPSQYAHSANVGTSCYLLSRQYKLESNLFYKKLYNQMEYLGSLFDFVNTTYELSSHLRQGKGENYGASIILHRCTGRLTGWVSYTYTHARRTFQDGSPHKAFAPSHERPHELNALWTYALGRHWDVGGTLVYASGTPYTPVNYLTVVNGNIISHYGDYNGARLRPYCRLDLSVNYKWKCRFAKECGLNLSIYNLSSSSNELFYYLSSDKEGNFSYRPNSFFVDMLPSISYYCKF